MAVGGAALTAEAVLAERQPLPRNPPFHSAPATAPLPQLPFHSALSTALLPQRSFHGRSCGVERMQVLAERYAFEPPSDRIGSDPSDGTPTTARQWRRVVHLGGVPTCPPPTAPSAFADALATRVVPRDDDRGLLVQVIATDCH